MLLANFFTITDDAKLAWLEALSGEETNSQKQIVEYRRYYGGDHDTELTDRLEAFLDNNAGKKFRLNQCPVVVESLVERLALTGFEETGIDEASEPEFETGDNQAGLIDFATKLLEDNRMDAGQEDLYRQAAIDHIAYLVLDIDPETGLLTFNLNDAYTDTTMDGDGDGVKLHYANAKRRGRPLFATKRWRTVDEENNPIRHFTVYYPDRIERYIDKRKDPGSKSSEAGWQRDIPQDGPQAGMWPQPWYGGDARPLGIPIIPFINGQASELHEVVPLQKALNKAFINFLAGSDMAGLGILFASGWVPTSDGKKIVTDERGQVTSDNEPLQIAVGDMLFSENPQAGLIRVPGDDLDKLVRGVDSIIIKIAQVSRTPITNFQLFGQIPSDATQRQLDTGLIAKAESRQRKYGNAWEDAIYLARRVALGAPVFDGGQMVGYGLDAYGEFDLAGAKGVRLSALWKDAVVRNEKEHLETLKLKKELGVSDEQIYLEMGYTPQVAERMAAEREARRVSSLGARFEANAQESANGGQQQQGQTEGE